MDERRQRMKERKIVYMLEYIIQKVTVEKSYWQPIIQFIGNQLVSVVNTSNSFKSWGAR